MMIGDGMPKEIAEAMVSDVASQDELMWVISNTSGVNGAVNMLYDENLQKLAEQLQDDLYILPSSIQKQFPDHPSQKQLDRLRNNH